MIVRIEYKEQSNYVEIELLDTIAAKKWLFVLNENLKKDNTWQSYSRYIAKYNQPNPTIHSKDVAYQKILEGIKGCNENVDGEQFPYTPSLNMNWLEIQKIHRAFTTSMTTLKTYSHKLDSTQLIGLKLCDVNKKRSLLKKWTKRTFTIKDLDKYIYFAHMINDGVHEYEDHLESDMSNDMAKEYNNIQVFNRYKNREDKTNIFLTPAEIEESHNQFLDCDVYIYSGLFGKPYLETYLENDYPLEADVCNVESITGEFSFMVGNNIKKFYTDSPFQKWMDKTGIPKHLMLPVPIGKIVGCSYKGDMSGWIEFAKRPRPVIVRWQKDGQSGVKSFRQV